MNYKKYSQRFSYRWLLSIPFIYPMIVPLIFFDISMEIFHQICFRLYNLPLIKRSQYIKIDRYKLRYLSTREKINCVYCSYANGLAHYFTVIAAETEKYWCGIKHAKDPHFIPPEHHKDFLEYGDEEAYKKLG